jgi:hypothetical protein
MLARQEVTSTINNIASFVHSGSVRLTTYDLSQNTNHNVQIISVASNYL